MYSRAIRMKDEKVSNPNLGPGCYVPDEQTLVSGKLLGEEGYAPFMSLAKKKCAFDEMVSYMPPPGVYNIDSIKRDNASVFGRSNDKRFGDDKTDIPGPGQYDIKGGIGIKSERNSYGIDLKSLKLNALERAIDKIVPGSQINLAPRKNSSSTKVDHDDDADHFDRIVAHGVKQDKVNNTKSILGIKSPNSSSPQQQQRNNSRSNITGRQKIVWKRKYVPPSIPMGESTFGYQETSAGELIPRKPPKRTNEPGLAYNHNTSFVEKSKHDNRGYKFGKSGQKSNKGRLEFQILDNPGPSQYESEQAEAVLNKPDQLLKDTSNTSALMTLAPCVRSTDVVILQEVKKAIPGPGYYSLESPIEKELRARRNRITFGGNVEYRTATGVEHNAINSTTTPGPFEYHPEAYSEVSHIPVRRQPFGSTSTRFERKRVFQAPSPGSYEVDKAEKMLSKKDNMYRGVKHKAFGSLTQRFEKMKLKDEPGPGQYNPKQIKNDLGFSAYNKLHHYSSNKNKSSSSSRGRNNTSRSEIVVGVKSGKSTPRGKRSHIGLVVKKGPKMKLAFGDVVIDPRKVHIPVFGSQVERFNDQAGFKSPPPPGSYNVSTSFNMIKSKGKLYPVSGLSSQTKREIFKPVLDLPGPVDYNPKQNSTSCCQQHLSSCSNNAKGGDGVFLSTENRFQNKFVDKKPAPNEYSVVDYDQGLIKKTFNVSFSNGHRPPLVVNPIIYD